MTKKTITLLIAIFFFSLMGIAQEKINWLKTSEFEKAVEKATKNCFIFIEDGIVNQNIPKEKAEKRKKQISHFLQDERFVKYVNDNFICYKFNSDSENLIFQGKEYKKTKERGKASHEFISFLTESKRSRLPAIILKDKNFKLFEYKKARPNIEEIQVLVDAERLKLDYITKKLGSDNKNTKQAEQMLRRQSKRLGDAKNNKINKSILPTMQNIKQLIRTLTYFVSESYKEKDLESYLKE